LRKTLDDEYKNCNRIAQTSVEDANNKLMLVEEELTKVYKGYQLNIIDSNVLQVS
jgi:hypothetical protein